MKRISVVSNIREKSRKFAPGISRAWRPPASGWTRSNVRTRVLHADAHAERKNCEQHLVLQLPKQHAQPPHLSLQRRTSRFCLGRRNTTTQSEKRVRALQQYCTRVHTFALEISHIRRSEYTFSYANRISLFELFCTGHCACEPHFSLTTAEKRQTLHPLRGRYGSHVRQEVLRRLVGRKERRVDADHVLHVIAGPFLPYTPQTISPKLYNIAYPATRTMHSEPTMQAQSAQLLFSSNYNT